jgi:predicted SprT family Zn-dependent metalloprotease
VNISDLSRALSKYVPSKALDTCVDWIVYYKIAVRITKSRNSKYGDYRPPSDGKGHRISVNHDLNKYAFLLTFTHEVAHLVAFSKFRFRIDPHGREWKVEFKRLMQPFLRNSVFPADLVRAIAGYLSNPAASSCSDINLTRSLAKYDKRDERWKLLEEISLNTPFRIRSGREFIKGELLNKNFCCTCLKSKHKYVINPLTEVLPIRKVGTPVKVRNKIL